VKPISSRVGFFSKRVVPALWFGMLALMLGSEFMQERIAAGMIVAILMFALIGFLSFSVFVWPLADEVLDAGDFLPVRRSGQEERVPVANIMNVSVTRSTFGPRVTLKIVQTGKFGGEIAFRPRFEFKTDPFANGEAIDDLIVRVDRARSIRPVRSARPSRLGTPGGR
jgi:hypothetical protein